MTPRLPQELIRAIIDFVAIRERGTKMQDLKSCSLTAQSWTGASQRHILQAVVIPSFGRLFDWVSEIDPADGISSYVRTLTLCGNGKPARRPSPDDLAKLKLHLTAFDKLECLNLKRFRLHSGVEHAELILEWFGLFRGELKTLNLESCSLSPSAFQYILHLPPLLDNISISSSCRAVINTEDDGALRPPLKDATNFRGGLITGADTPQEFLPCLLTVPLRFRRLVCVFSKEGYRIVSACAPTLQTLSLEGIFSPPASQGSRVLQRISFSR